MLRHIQMPLWSVIAISLIIGALTTSVLFFALARHTSEGRKQASKILGLPTTTLVQTTISATTTTSYLSSPTTRAPKPNGSLRIQGPGGSNNFGQSPSHSQCSNWHLLFSNNSDGEITRINFIAPSAEYQDWTFDQATQKYPDPIPAHVVPKIISVAIPPNQSQVVDFPTCTDTAYPGNQYEFSVKLLLQVGFTWAIGDTGYTTIN